MRAAGIDCGTNSIRLLIADALAVPGTPGGHLSPSSPATMTSLIGHGLPTVPGLASQSCGVASVPPPSVAA